MPAILQIKRSASNTAPSSLYLGELAYSWGTGARRLYIGTGSDIGNGAASNIDIIGGKYFTDKLSHTPGILFPNSAVIVDNNNRINRMFITDLTVSGNTDLSGNIKINGDMNIGGNVRFNNFTANNVVARLITANNIIIQDTINDLRVNNLTVTGTFASDDITSQNVNVLGNLNVIGALTNIFSEELNIADNIVILNSNLPPSSQPTESSGFTVNRGIRENVSFLWDENIDRWSIGSYDLVANTIYGDLEGNSATANNLAVPVTISLANTVIGSVLFDGSRNVTIQTQINVINGGTY